MHRTFGILGTGFVGGALMTNLRGRGIEVVAYDKGKQEGSLEAVAACETVFICVPTPYYFDTGFDLSYVHEAIQSLGNAPKTLIVKSTVVPGSTDALQAAYPQHKFLYSPEFLREVSAQDDMDHPERQIMGYTEQSKDVAQMVLDILPPAPFTKLVPATVAELTKYAGNAYLALRVSFANQLYELTETFGQDYDLVRECVAADSRIGGSHWQVVHQGYRGYGGKCFPKDVRALIELAQKRGIDLTLLAAAESYNNALVERQGLDVRWREGSPKRASDSV